MMSGGLDRVSRDEGDGRGWCCVLHLHLVPGYFFWNACGVRLGHVLRDDVMTTSLSSMAWANAHDAVSEKAPASRRRRETTVMAILRGGKRYCRPFGVVMTAA